MEVDAIQPLRRRRVTRLRWILGGLGLLTLMSIGLSSIEGLLQPVPASLVVSSLLSWYLWVLLFPLIWWVVRRYPLGRRYWWVKIPGYLAFGILISVVYQLLVRIKQDWVAKVGLAMEQGEPPIKALGQIFTRPQLEPASIYPFAKYSLLIYFCIVMGASAWIFYQKYRARELQASRLEAQLAQSQLNVLKMQLHPHFLFNTLNAISALMHRDVDGADRMISLLSELLRSSLDKDERHEVPLEYELQLLQRYLAIEEIRFRDRLRVDIDIDPECLMAQVPKLILQPLVENSIKHGISVRSAASIVSIQAQRRGDRLVLVVSDDGPGMPSKSTPLQEGVGLANTRARLEQIYGDQHRFELRNGRFGGFEAAIELPFEEEARVTAPLPERAGAVA